MSRVASVETWHIDVPVTPFPLGRRTIVSRDYTIVRIRDADGVEGVAWGLARRAPIAGLIRELIAPTLVGVSVEVATIQGVLETALGLHYREGLLSRAASLVDIALVDLLARQQRVPAWRLLAPEAEARPLRFSNVVGFEKADESDRDFVARVVARIDEGYGSIKLAASAQDPERFARRLADIRTAAPSAELIVDLDGSWSDVDGTVRMARDWERSGVAWIEDAVRVDRPDLVAALHDRLRAPLAIGDEATSLPLLLALVERRLVDILRADLTCVGGLSAAPRLATSTREAGIALSYHAYPWIHQHAALASGLDTVESFELDSPFEVSHRFLTPLPITRVNGEIHVAPPLADGIGVEVDWDFVEHHETG